MERNERMGKEGRNERLGRKMHTRGKRVIPEHKGEKKIILIDYKIRQ